jgi:hypothetical protein
MHFKLTAEHVDRQGRALSEVVAEIKVLAIAGPVLDDAALTFND